MVVGGRVARTMVAALAAAVAIGAAPNSAGAVPPAPDYAVRSTIALANADRLTTADLDGNGRPDLIATTGSTGSAVLRIALASGSGAAYGPFTSIPYPSSIIPQEPLAADLDGDGNLDIVTGSGSFGYSFVLGDGAGNFGSVQTSASAGNASKVAVGQFGGSSKPDLAIGRSSGIEILLGDGTGTFTDTGTSLPTNGSLRGLVAVDLDHDGFDDIASSAWAGSPLDLNMPSDIVVDHNNGDGTFDPPEVHEVINTTGSIDAGDVDEDGDPDLIIAAGKTSSSGAYVLIGAGDGTVAAPALAALADTPNRVSVGDVDDDGHLDLVGDDEGAFIAWGRGDGTFEPSVGYRSGFTATDAQVADVDGDGDGDLVSIGAASPPTPAGITLTLNAGGRNLRGVSMQTWANSEALAIGDVTGDGRPDHVQAFLRAGSKFQTFVNDGRGRLTPYRSGSLPSVPKAIAIGRIDGDAYGDVVGQTTAGLSVARSKGDGTYEAAVSYPAGTPPTTPPPPAIGDLDEDGHNDVVVVGSDATLQVLRGSASGTLSAPEPHPTGQVLGGTVLDDVDEDGILDLVGISAEDPTLLVFSGDGTGGFATTARTATLPAQPTYLEVDDIDGDGHDDAVATSGTNSATASAAVLLGDGTGSFDANGSIALPAWTYGGAPSRGLDAGDLNEDGHADLAVDGARTLVGDCAGDLHAVEGPSQQYDAPTFAHLADMDGDGHLDRVGRSINGYALTRFGLAPTTPATDEARPFTSCRDLVDQQYADLLGRSPSTTERAADARSIAAGSLSGGELVQRIRRSTDHLDHVDPVARLYRAYFGRNPDPGGLDYWVKRRRSGTWTLIKISNQFARSSEFQTKYGKLSNPDFVDLVYQNVLGRPGDPTGRAFWINRLDTKRATRGQVMLNFSESNEYVTKQASEVDAGVLLTWMLRTTPNGAAFDAAVAELDGGAPVSDVADEILASPAYEARVIGGP